MPTTTIYATGAGHWQDTAGDASYSRTDRASASESVSSGAPRSSKDSIGFWTWMDSPGLVDLEGSVIDEATVTLQCTTSDSTAPHSHSVEEGTSAIVAASSPPLGSPGATLGSITSTDPTAISCTDMVQGWADDPSTAYGVTTDLTSPENDATAHALGGFDTARITVTYTVGIISGVDTLGAPQTNGVSSFTPIEPLIEGATYSWRARVSDGSATSTWTPTRTFTIDTAAPVPPPQTHQMML